MNIIAKSIILLAGLFITARVAASVYEAETAVLLYKAETEDKNSGYSGESYINFENIAGSFLEMKIGMADEGSRRIIIRFANGTASTRTMNIFLNDSLVASGLSFRSTGSWTSWDTLSVSAFFRQGVNYMRLVSVSSDGGPNIDLFDISGEQANIFNLSLQTDGPGQILQIPAKGLLFENEEIVLVARPDYNSVFHQWTGDYQSENDTLKFILDSDKTIIAHFYEIEVYPPEPDFSLTGYASLPGEGLETTTGGEGGKIIYIASLAQLIAWGAGREDNSTPETVIIKGTIEAQSTTVISIKRGGNISVLGDPQSGGGYAELKNISFNIRQYSNVIIRNLKMHEVFYPDDDITIDECHHVWIDHCEFHSKTGPGIGVDTYDGLLDIKKGSHHVTVSWCFFHDHMKTVLIGHSDNNGEQDINLEATFHHNRFSNTDGRNPSLRFGKVHYFNNYLENISDYGFAVRNGAHALIENCHFENVHIPVATDKFEGHGFACISNCIYSGSCSEADNQVSEPFDCEFWMDQIPYSYNLESTNTVKISVGLYAGVGIINPVTSNHELRAANSTLKITGIYIDSFSEKLNIGISAEKACNIAICLYSPDGKMLVTENRELMPGAQTEGIVVNGLSRGVYIIAIDNGTERISRKVML